MRRRAKQGGLGRTGRKSQQVARCEMQLPHVLPVIPLAALFLGIRAAVICPLGLCFSAPAVPRLLACGVQRRVTPDPGGCSLACAAGRAGSDGTFLIGRAEWQPGPIGCPAFFRQLLVPKTHTSAIEDQERALARLPSCPLPSPAHPLTQPANQPPRSVNGTLMRPWNPPKLARPTRARPSSPTFPEVPTNATNAPDPGTAHPCHRSSTPPHTDAPRPTVTHTARLGPAGQDPRMQPAVAVSNGSAANERDAASFLVRSRSVSPHSSTS